MSQTNEWPKVWSDVIPDRKHDTTYLSSTDTWINMGTLRSYDGTLYINSSAGHPDTDGNEWMPLDVYIREQIQEESEKLNNQFAQEVIKDI